VLGAPGELLYNAKGNKQLAMHVEKAMHVNVLYHEMFTQENIKLLQLTAGHGSLRQAPPYKTVFCFFVLDNIEELGFVFKCNLSSKQLKHPKLPKGILMDEDTDNDDDDNDADAKEEEHVGDNSNDENGDDGGNDEHELHGGGVSSCARSSSRTCQQTNFFADHGKNVNSNNSDKGDSNDGEEDNLDNATGDELNNDGDDNDAMDDDDDIIDLTVESEDEKVLQMRRVSK
jgi:hypothetical protein